MKLFEMITLVATIVTALGGVGFVVVMIHTYKGQMNAQIFVEMNQRYDSIIRDLPKDALSARFSMETRLPPPSEALTLCAFRYLVLSSEEFYLYRRKYISHDVWEIWEGEMLRTLQSPWIRREWKLLASEFDSFPEFTQYVIEIQKK
jgi:hypothetical protein